MHELDHDIRVWLTREQYLRLKRLAALDDRPMSAYVRRLIARDLDESLDPDVLASMPAAGVVRDGAGR